jgi:transcriptional regulator with XRE-family HTH domain
MAWKEMSSDEIAKSLGVNSPLIREKHHLINLIKKARKDNNLSQLQLAKKMNITQGRIAQIESKVGTNNVTLETLLAILTELNYTYKISIKKLAA